MFKCTERMVYAQSRIPHEKWVTHTSLELWDTNGSTNQGQTIKPSECTEKKRTCRIVDFAIRADNRVKLKESNIWDKYLDLAREQKNYGTWKWCWYQL